MVRASCSRLPATSGKPRRDPAEVGQSSDSARDVSELSGDRDRSPRHGRWPEGRPPHPRHVAHAALHHRGIPARHGGADRWQLLEHARNTGGTVFHPTSTCKMGIDPMAVVDPELRVRGIEGVRVVDASMMPTVVSGNTNAATIMIGEKAADLVRSNGAWRRDRPSRLVVRTVTWFDRRVGAEVAPRGSLHPLIASTCGGRTMPRGLDRDDGISDALICSDTLAGSDNAKRRCVVASMLPLPCGFLSRFGGNDPPP